MTAMTAMSAMTALACEPPAQSFGFDREPVPVLRAEVLTPAAPDPDALVVMAWNVKYGAKRANFWFDYWGDEVELPPEVVSQNLADLAALVREVDPDVLLVEEIEVGSRRSAYVDMVQVLLDQTSLNYAAYFSTWDSRYVASEGVGRIDLGNAIFSKYPIPFAERIRQPDRTDQSGLVSTFYIHRMIGRAVLDLGPREVAAFVVHTEAYDRDGTKRRQLEQIHDEVSRETRPLVLGGDFNELPPTAARIQGFDDEHPSALGTEFEQPPYTPEAMRPFYDELSCFVPLERYGVTEDEQRPFFTHTVIGPGQLGNGGEPAFWNRTLDYLFIRRTDRWTPGSTDVLQTPGRLGITSDPMTLSDHAPVVGRWEIRR